MSGPRAADGTIESLSIDLLAELFPDLEDLDHDLGKYIGLQTRFCGLDVSDDELRQALQADLLATRKRGERVWTAWELWAERRPEALGADAAVVSLDAMLATLSRCSLDGDRASLLEVVALTGRVRACCRGLLDRARARLEAADKLPDLW